MEWDVRYEMYETQIEWDVRYEMYAEVGERSD